MPTNKAIVEEFLKALGRGDVGALTSIMTDDIEAVCTGTSMFAGIRTLSDICGAARFLRKITTGGIVFDVLSMTAEADRVSCEAKGRSTLVAGGSYDNEYHFLFFIRDSRICKIKEYIDSKLADAVLGPLVARA